jgi:hypothetical protein
MVHSETHIYHQHKLKIRNIFNHMQLIILLTLSTFCTYLSISLSLVYTQKENDIYWAISVPAANVAVARLGRLGQLAAADIHSPDVNLWYILIHTYTACTN